MCHLDKNFEIGDSCARNSDYWHYLLELCGQTIVYILPSTILLPMSWVRYIVWFHNHLSFKKPTRETKYIIMSFIFGLEIKRHYLQSTKVHLLEQLHLMLGKIRSLINNKYKTTFKMILLQKTWTNIYFKIMTMMTSMILKILKA